MHKLIPLIVLLITTPSLAEEIFKWVDESGQMHFSDVPKEGATEVEIAPAQTFSAPSAPNVATSSAATTESAVGAAQEAVSYAAMEITSPAMEETIWNTGGEITVTVRLQPGLKTGHQIRMFLDGKPLPNLRPNTSSQQVSNVYRGEHQLRAQVWDENGAVLITADPSTFFYQQTSVNRR
jgi:hypothetical protein